jgi:hypothetical protein
MSILPDLLNFPRLIEFIVKMYDKITTTSSNGSLTTLTTLKLECCSSLTIELYLEMFLTLKELHLDGCMELTVFSSIVPLIASKRLYVKSCNTLKAMLDLGMFPTFETLVLNGCSKLVVLSNKVLLIGLQWLCISRCVNMTLNNFEHHVINAKLNIRMGMIDMRMRTLIPKARSPFFGPF